MTVREFSFAGVSGAIDQRVRDEFDVIYDDTNSLYDTIESYEHVEEGFSFKYKYAVQVTDLYGATGEEEHENYFLVELYLVVCPESMKPEIVEEMAEQGGIDEEYLNAQDNIINGYGAVFLGEEVAHESELETVIQGAMTAHKTINGMRGFFLDRYVNGLGETGWDVIREVIKG